MSYHIYTTTAIVCGSYDQSVSDKVFVLYTESLGMIYATAKSVREERSKQRYALQDFSIIKVSLVRGKAGWRIGSVVDIAQPFLAATNRETRSHILIILRTVRRFISGTEPSPVLFTIVYTGMSRLAANAISNPDQYVLLLVARILYELGYIAPTPEQLTLLQEVPEVTTSVVDPKLFSAMQKAVHEAQTASHL